MGARFRTEDPNPEVASHWNGYSWPTVEAALPDAERYCRIDGRAWVMEDKNGRYHVVNPYSPGVEEHYLNKLGWRLARELKVTVVITGG